MIEKFEKYLYQTVFPLKPPETIYHYTTQKGILGIIPTRTMWATQAHFLNDRNEVFLTFKLLERELRRMVSESSNQQHRSLLNEIRHSLSKVDQTHICTVSFCESGDLLSQWRGYAAQGKGYAMGFDLAELSIIAKQQNFVVWPCVYNPTLQLELVKYLIHCWIEKFSEQMLDHGKMIEEINTSICKLAPILKDESFIEEQEWRLVSTATGGEKNMAFREGVFSLIPYLNFKICDQNSKDCLNKIVVGPSPHTDLATNSLSMFLKQNKLPKVEIVTSRIPFRNWK